MARAPQLPHPSAHTVGVVGALVGLAAAGTAAGVALTRIARRRLDVTGLRPADLAGVPDAELRANDPLGDDARRADRTAVVMADDGVPLNVEEVGPPDAPLTVVFVHGYTLSMGSWAFQRRTLGAQLATANGHRPTARLVFYDQRGHGGSGRGPSEHSTIEQLACDLAAVLEARVPNSSGRSAASPMTVIPPIEWPTSTIGPRGTRASSTAARSHASCSMVECSLGPRPEPPCPRWS